MFNIIIGSLANNIPPGYVCRSAFGHNVGDKTRLAQRVTQHRSLMGYYEEDMIAKNE